MLAIVQKVSPLAKAHGAVDVDNMTKNQGASFALYPHWDFHPPMATLSPSACTSILNTYPNCSARTSQSMLWTTKSLRDR